MTLTYDYSLGVAKYFLPVFQVALKNLDAVGQHHIIVNATYFVSVVITVSVFLTVSCSSMNLMLINQGIRVRVDDA